MRTYRQMSNRHFCLIVLLLASITWAFSSSAQEAEFDPTGDWTGNLEIPGGGSLTLVLHIEADGDSLKATMDSPDQGAIGIPVSKVTFKEDKLFAEVATIGGEYRGTLEEGGTFKGSWSQGPMKLPLNLERQTEPVTLNRPQEPKEPFPYEVTEVTFTNREHDVRLAGTWTVPKGEGPFPAAVLISGSGPQDRDETLMGHRPFLVLADHLTRQGIAVLRYDDRGTAESTGDFSAATSADLAKDTEAAVDFLTGRPEVASITLVGHSEGGMIAPMVAAGNSAVDALVLLAGPGTSGRQVLLDQTERAMELTGAPKETRQKQRRLQGEVFDQLLSGNEEATRKAMAALIEVQTAGALSKKDLKAQVETHLKPLQSPWFRYFLTYDPRPTLSRVTQPVLAINGEKDFQVLAAENLQGIAQALKKGGNQQVETLEMKGLNHLFQTAETGALSEYGKIEETFAPAALEKVSSWILARQAGKEE